MTAGQLNATMTHQPAATSHRPDISLQPVSNGTTQRPVSNKVTQQPLSHSTAPQPALQATQVKAEPASPVRQGSAEVLAAASAQNPAQPQTHVASQLPAASAAAAAPASGPTEPAAAQPCRDPRLTDLAASPPFPQQQAPAALPAGRHTDHPTQQASSAALAASQRLLAASEELAQQQQQPVRPVHIAIYSPRAMPAVAHPQAVAPQVPSSRPAADAHTVSHAQRSLQAADRQASPTAMQRRESAQPAALQAKRSGPQLSSDSPVSLLSMLLSLYDRGSFQACSLPYAQRQYPERVARYFHAHDWPRMLLVMRRSPLRSTAATRPHACALLLQALYRTQKHCFAALPFHHVP